MVFLQKNEKMKWGWGLALPHVFLVNSFLT